MRSDVVSGRPARVDDRHTDCAGRWSPQVLAHLHRIGPLLILLLGLAAVVGSAELGLGSTTRPAPGLWPFVVALLVTLTAALLLFLDKAEDYEPWTSKTVRIAAGLAGLGVFIVLFQAFGFTIPAFLMLVLWLRFFGEESWRWALSLAVGGAVGLHLLFVEAFGVPFPEDVLTRALGG